MTPRSPLLPQKTLGSDDPGSFPVSGDGFGLVSRVFEGVGRVSKGRIGPGWPGSHNPRSEWGGNLRAQHPAYG